MKKVLHVYKTFTPYTYGGVEEFIDQLIKGTSLRGYQNWLLSFYPGERIYIEKRAGLKIYWVPARLNLLSMPISLKVRKVFQRLLGKVDLVHYHFPFPLQDVLNLLNKDKPYIVTYHSDVVKQKVSGVFYKPLSHYFIRNASAVIATSRNYAESSTTLLKFRRKIRIIPIGIEDVTANVMEDKWKKRLGRDFFLFVGALRYYKGLATLVEAARINHLPTVIAGSGPELKVLKKQADGVKNIIFLDHVSHEDKLALFNLCGCFVFPSNKRSEAFGISLVEACRAGKPMISCEIGTGTSFVNMNGVTGITVPPDNPQVFSQAMQKIYSDESLREGFGLAARKWYEVNFTSDVMIQSYIKIYDELIP